MRRARARRDRRAPHRAGRGPSTGRAAGDRSAAGGALVIKAIVIRLFIHIADGDNLDIIVLEQPLGIGASLAASADYGNVDFLTGCDISPAAENVTRQEGKCRDGGRRLYKITGKI